jgi:hypothetical protein
VLAWWLPLGRGRKVNDFVLPWIRMVSSFCHAEFCVGLLSTKQRAIVGARMATLGRGEPEEKCKIAQLPMISAGLLGVLVRSINAKHVLENGHPKLVEERPLRDVGPPTKEERDNVGTSNNTVGNTNDYLLRRLARDAPEMLDRIEARRTGSSRRRIRSGVERRRSSRESLMGRWTRSR